jgi:hypothetical protein
MITAEFTRPNGVDLVDIRVLGRYVTKLVTRLTDINNPRFGMGVLNFSGYGQNWRNVAARPCTGNYNGQ